MAGVLFYLAISLSAEQARSQGAGEEADQEKGKEEAQAERQVGQDIRRSQNARRQRFAEMKLTRLSCILQNRF